MTYSINRVEIVKNTSFDLENKQQKILFFSLEYE